MSKLIKILFILMYIFISITIIFAGGDNEDMPANKPINMGNRLTYLGHASIKINTIDNIVIYIDPWAGDDYSEPADIILVTHGHRDHNDIDKVAKKDAHKIIAATKAVPNSDYAQYVKSDDVKSVMGIKITAVPAFNKNHQKDRCVGFIIEFQGIKLYHAGDTSLITEMNELADHNITYALLPMDDVYNMGPLEAMECAEIIKAKYYIPIHTGPNGVYSQENIDKFAVANKIVLKPGDGLELFP